MIFKTPAAQIHPILKRLCKYCTCLPPERPHLAFHLGRTYFWERRIFWWKKERMLGVRKQFSFCWSKVSLGETHVANYDLSHEEKFRQHGISKHSRNTPWGFSCRRRGFSSFIECDPTHAVKTRFPSPTGKEPARRIVHAIFEFLTV